MIQLVGKYYTIFSWSLENQGTSSLIVCLNETYRTVHTGKNLTKFPIQNGLKQEGASPLVHNFALEYAIKRVQKNQEGLKLNETNQLLAYADDKVVEKRRYHKEKQKGYIRC
jgi:hypothetical protein